MSKGLVIALLASCLLAAAPAVALAQSAGDGQYQDPLPPGGSSGAGGGGSSSTGGGGSSTSGGGGTSSTGSGGSTGTTQQPAPTTTTETGQTPVAQQSTPQTTTVSSPGELPRTGGHPELVAIFGVGMLLMGTSVMLVVPRRD